MDTDDQWRERRKLLLKTARVYDRLDDLIAGAKANEISLAVFKPTRITDFVWEEEERAWDPDKVREMRDATKQYDLFADNTWRETFKVIDKLPYSFSYKFEDATGKKSELQVLDWEAGALYWNCLRSTDGDEPKALAKVRQKYFDEFTKKDLHFFLGTTQQFHFVARTRGSSSASCRSRRREAARAVLSGRGYLGVLHSRRPTVRTGRQLSRVWIPLRLTRRGSRRARRCSPSSTSFSTVKRKRFRPPNTVAEWSTRTVSRSPQRPRGRSSGRS
jgi:hypothetical protein